MGGGENTQSSRNRRIALYVIVATILGAVGVFFILIAIR